MTDRSVLPVFRFGQRPAEIKGDYIARLAVLSGRSQSLLLQQAQIAGCFRKQPVPEGRDLWQVRRSLSGRGSSTSWKATASPGNGRTRRPLRRSHAASVVRASATPCPSIAASISMLAQLSSGSMNSGRKIIDTGRLQPVASSPPGCPCGSAETSGCRPAC